MNEERIKELINGYFDNEISREEETLLFSVLAENENGREIFKSLAAVNEAIGQTREEFPNELDEKIISSLSRGKKRGAKGNSFLNPPALFAYAVAAVLIIFFLMFKTDLDKYKKELQTQASIVKRQTKMIELLYNALPTATVKAERKPSIVVTPEAL